MNAQYHERWAEAYPGSYYMKHADPVFGTPDMIVFSRAGVSVEFSLEEFTRLCDQLGARMEYGSTRPL